MDLKAKIEAVLFLKGEPISKKRLAEILSANIDEINSGLEILKSEKNRGIVIVDTGDEVVIGTNPELSELLENLQKEELNKELSKASLETLSIILYKKNGANRSEIDYIRGVNSSFTLRLLMMRGLIERSADPKDNRIYVYKPSFDLLSYLGIKSIEELPDFEEINNLTPKPELHNSL